MSAKLLSKATLIWLALAAAAFSFGAVREVFLKPAVGEPLAHQLGTIAVCVVFAWICWRFTAAHNLTCRSALAVGLWWVGLTLAFEFGFFHYVMGTSWQELLAAYNVAEGRLWGLVPLTEVVVPYIAAVYGRPVSGYEAASQPR